MLLADISQWGPWEFGGAVVAILAVSDSLYNRFTKWLDSRDKSRDENKAIADAWPRLDKKIDDMASRISKDNQAALDDHERKDDNRHKEILSEQSQLKRAITRVEVWIEKRNGLETHSP